MKTFLAVLILMGLSLLGMALGMLLGGKCLKGSCGGLSAVTNEDGATVCGICGKDVAEVVIGSCEESNRPARTSP